MYSQIISRLGRLYDRIYCERNLSKLEKVVTVLACVGFMGHLLAIFIARQMESAGFAMAPGLDRNYLHAVYTPFSFILFFEVLLLVLSLQKSMSSAIGKQYEIIALIVIRGVFKDIGKFEDLQHWTEQTDATLAVVLDMGAAAAMFLLVTIFYHVRRRGMGAELGQNVESFISLKKSVAFLLSILLFCLTIYSLVNWTVAAVKSLFGAEYLLGDLDLIFFPQFYGVMIFADVFLLIASFSTFNRFELVFRNAGFVISTVLLRFSLTAPKPLDIIVALTAMTFGVVVLAIFNYCAYVSRAMQSSIRLTGSVPAQDSLHSTVSTSPET